VDGEWGALVDGKWDGMIGMVDRKVSSCQFTRSDCRRFLQEADMATGDLTITEERAAVVNFAWPAVEVGIGLISHVNQQLPKWEAIAWPFQAAVWAMVLTTFLVFLVCLWTLSWLFDNASSYDGFSKAVAVFLDISECELIICK
jgi:hypothetical protein